jgi:hypothetical protein
MTTDIGPIKARLDDFWVQPCEGTGDPRGVGVSESVLREVEARAGIELPASYRALMKLQNGGYVRRRAYYDGREFHQIFINGAEIDSIDPEVSRLPTLLELLESFMSEAEIREAAAQLPAWQPHRLIVISSLAGHGLVGLDYGYRIEKARDQPEVVLFEDDYGPAKPGYSEELRVQSFDAFVAGLVYYGYESESFHFGTTTARSLEEVARVLEQAIGLPLMQRTDDRYGWFDFNAYYTVSHYLDGLGVHSTLSPNQFRSGTRLFQERADVKCIFEIRPKSDAASRGWSIETNRILAAHVLDFIAKLVLPEDLKFEMLQMPFHGEEP